MQRPSLSCLSRYLVHENSWVASRSVLCRGGGDGRSLKVSPLPAQMSRVPVLILMSPRRLVRLFFSSPGVDQGFSSAYSEGKRKHGNRPIGMNM